MKIKVIVAVDSKYGIGKNNSIPWNIPSDLKYFKEITTSSKKKNVLIMGRVTWDSIPEKFKPLSGRLNYIISSQDLDLKKYKNTLVFKSIKNAIKFSLMNCLAQNLGDIFIIGGSSIYTEVIKHIEINHLYLTRIYKDFNCDKKFMDKSFFENNKFKNLHLIKVSNFQEENGLHFRFFEYSKQDKLWESPENQYLNLLKKILDEGLERDDRTGTGTLALFGERQEYNLEDTFPILTTKRIFIRAVFEELMLYLRGETDNKILNQKNIHIWDGNTSRNFLNSRGLTNYPEGDMGETYGFNFRHFGGEYINCETKYDNCGFDQVSNVINLIKNEPFSRRIIISLWNPNTNHKASLPSCLCWYQFFVDTISKKLNLQIYIRSSDFFLANNWNICTGALLVHMICNLENIEYTPGKIICITGDTHIYKNHIEQASINLERISTPFPKLIVKGKKNNVEEFTWEDFSLIGYEPQPNIKADISV
tara:strand:+ start:1128 stop:2561 length:1434 start_codon:yes stop_codon:yes gene_type:complete